MKSQVQFVVLCWVLLLCAVTSSAAESKRSVVYDFGATWCGACRHVAPTVEKLAREGLPIQKVDVDKYKKFADSFHLEAYPTFVLVIDGKEVDRVTGALSEAQLRKMIARIPKKEPEAAEILLANSKNATPPGGKLNVPVSLGDPAAFRRGATQNAEPQATVETQSSVADAEPAQDAEKRLSIWPFNKKSEVAPAAPSVVRATDAELNSVTESELPPETTQRSLANDPNGASVRIRVNCNGRIDVGSGTVISSKPGISHILTCAHIFRGATSDARIIVEVFHEGVSTTHVARLEKADEASDLGLITIPTNVPLPVAKVGTREAAPRTGDTVAAIGCSGGDDPTMQKLQVTDIDKYEGPHNVLCTGVPVKGRSGGGLFNVNGDVIGVCSAADPEEKRGFYSGLLAIHQILDSSGLASLYRPTPPPRQTPPEIRTVEEPRSESLLASAEPANGTDRTQFAETSTQGTAAEPLDIRTGPSEVVVIIRDQSQPDVPNRVVILHQPSEKFMAYLSGELDEGSAASVVNANASASSQGIHRREVHPIGRSLRSPQIAQEHAAPSPRDTARLVPTGLSQPIAPQRYVRSAGSR